MTFALLIAITTCAAAWFMTGHPQRRGIGAVFGLIDSILWLFAGVNAGKIAVVLVAVFCVLCFARPFLRTHVFGRLRKRHTAYPGDATFADVGGIPRVQEKQHV